MAVKKIFVAAALAMAAGIAQADSVSFSYSAITEEITSSTFNYLQENLTGGSLTTNGMQTVTSGGVSASVNGWADATKGLFKSYVSVNQTGAQQVNISGASVSLDVVDTLKFAGNGSTVSVTFTMNYDTTFSGLGMTPFQRVNQIDHSMTVSSDRWLSLSYAATNPNYDAGCESAYEMPCAEPITTIMESADKSLFKQISLGGPNGVYSNGDANNGNYSGVVTLTAIVPTNTEITLNYKVSNSVGCFHLANCALASDALHSDYLGLKVDGGTFTSTSAFQYLGVAAAVPEPESYAMLLAGLGLIGGIARRRSRHSR